MQKKNSPIENAEAVSDNVTRPVVKVKSKVRESEMVDGIGNEAERFAEKLEGLFVDRDVWLSAENSRQEDCGCGSENNENVAETPSATISGFSETPGKYEERRGKQCDCGIPMESSSDNNVSSVAASDLLQSVVESYRDALTDQRSIMASQTEAINRLAAAIEAQTKMISFMLPDNNL